ncbi:FAD-dependent oxidoreductase [Aeromicrobium wangtongii]|uniref:ferredoxin--NADP(+) reductase n=1 Tax=Aeromicrobium wangtongii TaxID=2969247 RepID=A0ABY5M203_9ACTN|nr:FAD-dependent oxidoreductase [Aeromicrobium wangtongii]MCD9198204.1 FAD-dependent oxidoreductase [Aeromicrobium wangtongii]UUP12240.1 FAD-dependent oxidoreductase [Aeromicrobium wangtongii]
MPHVVTQACCGDASCVFACPVNAIHPTPDEPDFGLAEMLYIDPVSCVDCGACVTACPVGAISAQDKLTDDQLPFVDVNALFHAEPRDHPAQAPVAPVLARTGGDELRVAIVGSGPAALYTADELLKRPGVRVTVLDRLPTPHGLVRAGVAPDHQTTKGIDRLFRQIEDQDGFAYALGVEVGTDITHAELAAHHHAVVYATGASADRRLGIPGEDLPGSATATAFVAWYNGHPEHADRTFDLSGDRVVVVGNGNVALDVARILATDPDRLSSTDIADHALEALRASSVREIVLLGRRGAADAAFTLPELLGLVARDDIAIAVEGDDLLTASEDATTQQKLQVLRSAAARPARPGARRIVFRFATSPTSLEGTHGVESVLVRRNAVVTDAAGVRRAVATDDTDSIATTLVLRSIGYRGTAIPGVPFDEVTATIPHERGRVLGLPGSYVVGWIKRGPSGFIGTNKSCAQETVDTLVADANAGRLASPIRPARAMLELVESRSGAPVDRAGWRAIDRQERLDGAPAGRPRRKMVRVPELVAAAAVADGPGRRRRRPGRARR